MNPDAPSPLDRALRWSFPGFVFASFLLLPIAQHLQETLFAKLGWVNPVANFSIGHLAAVAVLLLMVVTTYTSWKAASVLENGRNSMGEHCLITWNTVVMFLAGLSSVSGTLFTLVNFFG